ncbi:MAG: adenylate kinase [Saprospiraceae bacterium]|nr:adenylate kinase [Saprospiraceae bacterium]
MKVIILLGPPYSGKGTQCDLLAKNLKIQHISTGDRIRKEKEEKTEFGKLMLDYNDKGILVPDSIMEKLLAQILEENRNAEGIIFDGYPRTVSQVDTLLQFLKERGISIDAAINIEVDKEELFNRAKERAKNSTRKDDQDEAVHLKRITDFYKDTLPAIQYLKAQINVTDVDGMGSIKEVYQSVTSVVNA